MAESWEEVTQSFVDALNGQRAGFWAAADLVRNCLEDCPEEVRATRMRELAEYGHCSARQIAKLERLGNAFPVEWRYPDVSQVMYMAVLDAATRTNRKATAVLDEALRKNWGPVVLARMGASDERRVYSVNARCIACGGYVSFRRKKSPGLLVPCPGCLADARAARRTLLDAFVIVGKLI